MPFIVGELFASVRRLLQDYLQLQLIEPLCRYFWHDGTTLDASSHTEKMQEALMRVSAHDADAFPRFLEHGRKLYELAAPTFLFQPFSSLAWHALMQNIRYVPSFFRIDAWRTYNEAIETFFEDKGVRQLFNRFATYNGSSPYRAPATLTMIPAIEFLYGGWYIRGGMYTLAQALERSDADLLSLLPRLRAQDIDFARNEILVRDGKGAKDRVVRRPQSLKRPFEEHLRKVKGVHEKDLADGWGHVALPDALDRKYPNASGEWRWQWVFPQEHRWTNAKTGEQGRHHVDESIVQKAFKQAVEKAGLTKRATCHTLRRSFATHLIEAGYCFRTVQELLGHKDVRTTMVYTHVLNRGGKGVKSPVDAL